HVPRRVRRQAGQHHRPAVRLAAKRRGRDPDARWGLLRAPDPTELGTLAGGGVVTRRAGLRPDAVRGDRGLAGSPHTRRPRRRRDAPGPPPTGSTHTPRHRSPSPPTVYRAPALTH